MILASLLGNYPRIGDRPAEQILRRALHAADHGDAAPSTVTDAEDEMTRLAMREQIDAGMDILTDGQVRWHDPISHVARGLSGVRIEGLLRYFDTNTYYRQPVVSGSVARPGPILVEAFRFAASLAAPRPVKAIVTGPVTLARLSRDARGGSRRNLTLEIASALNRELLDLEAAGAALVQIDEPVLARVPEDAELGRLAMRRMVAGLRSAQVLLATSFGDVLPLFSRLSTLPVSFVGLDVQAALGRVDDREAATRLGSALAAAMPPGVGLMLGVVDGRNTRLEDPADLHERRLGPILEGVRAGGGPPRDVHLVPNHGLELLPRDTALAKMTILAALRDRAKSVFE